MPIHRSSEQESNGGDIGDGFDGGVAGSSDSLPVDGGDEPGQMSDARGGDGSGRNLVQRLGTQDHGGVEGVVRRRALAGLTGSLARIGRVSQDGRDGQRVADRSGMGVRPADPLALLRLDQFPPGLVAADLAHQHSVPGRQPLRQLVGPVGG